MFTPDQLTAHLVINGLAKRSRAAWEETAAAPTPIPARPARHRPRHAVAAVLSRGSAVLGAAAAKVAPAPTPRSQPCV